MSVRVYLSTEDAVVGEADAKISVFDRGFLFGDAVFETLRTVAGPRLLDGAAHLERLRRSAGRVGIDVPWADDTLEDVVRRTCVATGADEHQARVIVTRGQGPLLLDPRTATRPTLVVIAKPLSLPDPAVYRRGLDVVIVGTARSADGLLDATVKSANYLANVQALRIAAERGADDALLCSPRGTVTEGATSNVFCVVAGRLVTPPLDGSLLPGITRGVVCDLARRLGLAVEERPL
ncbi:MAG: aminotransferase, partial [Deltaproteobacteria bacterium]